MASWFHILSDQTFLILHFNLYAGFRAYRLDCGYGYLPNSDTCTCDLGAPSTLHWRNLPERKPEITAAIFRSM